MKIRAAAPVQSCSDNKMHRPPIRSRQPCVPQKAAAHAPLFSVWQILCGYLFRASTQRLSHALRKLNYDLKQLAVYCGIKLNVSSYTSRHTWATLAKYCHFSEQLICDALGHSSTKVTETYLKSFKNDELDRANKVIINHISISI